VIEGFRWSGEDPMTAFRYFGGSKRAWISCGLLGMLVAFGGFRLAAQTGVQQAVYKGFLGSPTATEPTSHEMVLPQAAAQLPVTEPASQQTVLQQTSAQRDELPPPRSKVPTSQDGATAYLFRESLGPEVLFRLESEEEMRRRIRQERKGQRVEFPDSRIILSKTPFAPRDWDVMEEAVEPYYSVYRRLYFEQINAERYGWDYGFFAPLIAVGTFYFDFASLPFQFFCEPCRRYEYNSGLCLPGDPVPLYLYPPHPK
jgi:hypothetical protein